LYGQEWPCSGRVEFAASYAFCRNNHFTALCCNLTYSGFHNTESK
jgi:hypothetical protein